MVNENFETEKEERYNLTLDKDIIAKVSERKVRIINNGTIVLTILIKDKKLEVFDFWGWGEG